MANPGQLLEKDIYLIDLSMKIMKAEWIHIIHEWLEGN